MWKQSAEMPQVYGQPLDSPHAGSKTGQPVLSFSNKNRGALLEKAPRRFRFGVGQKKTFTAN